MLQYFHVSKEVLNRKDRKKNGIYPNEVNRIKKFVKFMSDLASSQIEEGTILEVTVKKPDGRTMVSNIKVTASDLEMLQAIKQM